MKKPAAGRLAVARKYLLALWSIVTPALWAFIPPAILEIFAHVLFVVPAVTPLLVAELALALLHFLVKSFLLRRCQHITHFLAMLLA